MLFLVDASRCRILSIDVPFDVPFGSLGCCPRSAHVVLATGRAAAQQCAAGGRGSTRTLGSEVEGEGIPSRSVGDVLGVLYP